MFNKTTYLLLGFFLIVSSCRKGDEDPFLSLSSRKARISGDWEMTDLFYSEANYVNGNQNGTIFSESGNADKIIGMELNGTDTSNFEKKINSFTIQINKEGTWEKSIDYEIITVFENADNDETTAYKHQQVFTQSGTWSFLNKIKDVYKNKERVHFSILNNTYDYAGGTSTTTSSDGTILGVYSYPSFKDITTYAEGEETRIYDIIMLKSKEMKWERKNGSENNIDDEFFPYNQTFDLLETITWLAQ